MVKVERADLSSYLRHGTRECIVTEKKLSKVITHKSDLLPLNLSQ